MFYNRNINCNKIKFSTYNIQKSLKGYFMIVLNKKRLMLIGSCVFLSLFVFFFTAKSNEKQDLYISTVNLPVSGKTVVVDAGHGKPDERSREFKRNCRGRN